MCSSDANPELPFFKSSVAVLESFYRRYGTDRVRLVLFSVFQGYALNQKRGFPELEIGEQEVAEVLDGLVELVSAVQMLMEEGRIEGMGV